MYKFASAELVVSGVVHDGPCTYHGFAARSLGSSHFVRIWDNPTDSLGRIVEAFDVDSAKPTDGHEHSVPIFCSSGLYAGPDDAPTIVYYTPLSSSNPNP